MGKWYDGPSAYIDTDEAVLLQLVPGHYALNEGGKGLALSGLLRKRPIRLVMVNDAPHDPRIGACHLEYARKGDPIAREGRITSIEAQASGKTEVF